MPQGHQVIQDESSLGRGAFLLEKKLGSSFLETALMPQADFSHLPLLGFISQALTYLPVCLPASSSRAGTGFIITVPTDGVCTLTMCFILSSPHKQLDELCTTLPSPHFI